MERPGGMRLFRRITGNRRLCDQTVLNQLLAELANRGRLEEVRWLLLIGAEANCDDYGVRPAMGGAIASGKLELVQMLIRSGASLISPHAEMSYLGIAAFSGEPTIMGEILERGADPNAPVCDKEGIRWDVPPLIFAIAENHLECVRLLLRFGANPNVVCYDLCSGFGYDCLPSDHEMGWNGKGPPCTPLVMAETTGNRAIARLLLEHGAIPKTHAPIEAEMVRIRAPIGLRARSVAPIPPVLELIRRQAGFEEIRRKLTWVGDLNAKNGCLLAEACLARRLDVIRHLLELGANPNAMSFPYLPDLDGGKTEIARLLLEHGYDGKIQQCHIPLLEAISHGHLQLVRLLLDRGCDLNLVPRPLVSREEEESWDIPPLMTAINHGQQRCAAYLLERGADPNVACRGFPNPAGADGIFCLLGECLGSNFDLYPWYVAPGETRIGRDGVGTPLHLAILNIDLWAVALLMKYGADPTRAPHLDKYVKQVQPPELRARFQAVLANKGRASDWEPTFGSYIAPVRRIQPE